MGVARVANRAIIVLLPLSTTNVVNMSYLALPTVAKVARVLVASMVARVARVAMASMVALVARGVMASMVARVARVAMEEDLSCTVARVARVAIVPSPTTSVVYLWGNSVVARVAKVATLLLVASRMVARVASTVVWLWATVVVVASPTTVGKGSREE